MAKLVNLTQHAVTVLAEDGSTVEVIEPSGTEARVEQRRVQVDSLWLNGNYIPINRSEFGQVEGLPEPTDGVFFVVSMLTAQAATGRDDLLIVDDTVRDEAGRIIGCRAFSRV